MEWTISWCQEYMGDLVRFCGATINSARDEAMGLLTREVDRRRRRSSQIIYNFTIEVCVKNLYIAYRLLQMQGVGR